MKKILPFLILLVAVGVAIYFLVDKNSRDADLTPIYTNETGDYNVKIPKGWVANTINQGTVKGVVFSKEEQVEGVPTQIFISKQTITDIEGVETMDQWYTAQGVIEGSDFVIKIEDVTRNNVKMKRILTKADNDIGIILTYVYTPDDVTVIALSHFPYDAESDDTKTFEELVNSFNSIATPQK